MFLYQKGEKNVLIGLWLYACRFSVEYESFVSALPAVPCLLGHKFTLITSCCQKYYCYKYFTLYYAIVKINLRILTQLISLLLQHFTENKLHVYKPLYASQVTLMYINAN